MSQEQESLERFMYGTILNSASADEKRNIYSEVCDNFLTILFVTLEINARLTFFLI